MTAHEHDMVREFHEAFDVTIRTVPDNTTVSGEEQLLRAKLVLEEAFEFAAAMGVVPCDSEGHEIKHSDITYDIYESIDLVESADALADLLYVTYGSAHTLGLPIREIFAAVHASNMEKLGPDGKPIYRPSDGKVMKPPGWVAPQSRITTILLREVQGD